MTIAEQKRLISELIASVKADIFDGVYDFPTDWEAPEIRQYVTDAFAARSSRFALDGAKLRNYRNSDAYRNIGA